MLVNSNQNWFVRFVIDTLTHIILHIFLCVKTTVKALDHFKVATKSGIRVMVGIGAISGSRTVLVHSTREMPVDIDICSRKHGL